MRTENISVVIAGGGSAAFEAAVASKQSGAARVVMLEKAPAPEFGGNARFSHTGFRFAYSGADEIRGFMPNMERAAFDRLQLPGYTPADFMTDLMRVTRGRINKDLAEVLRK